MRSGSSRAERTRNAQARGLWPGIVSIPGTPPLLLNYVCPAPRLARAVVLTSLQTALFSDQFKATGENLKHFGFLYTNHLVSKHPMESIKVNTDTLSFPDLRAIMGSGKGRTEQPADIPRSLTIKTFLKPKSK